MKFDIKQAWKTFQAQSASWVFESVIGQSMNRNIEDSSRILFGFFESLASSSKQVKSDVFLYFDP